MQASEDLTSMERDAYRAAFADGIIDLFLGLSFVLIGAIWIWATDFAGLAGILPAIMAPTLLPLRKQVVEPHGGYVKWSGPRRRWERRNYWAMLLGGVLVFLLGIGAYLMAANSAEGTDVLGDLAPGLLAFILAIVAVALGFMMEAPRLFAYSAALVVGGIVTVTVEANPGWPLFGSGIVISVIAASMLIRYLHDNPVADQS